MERKSKFEAADGYGDESELGASAIYVDRQMDGKSIEDLSASDSD